MEHAVEEERRAEAKAEWNEALPFMALQMLKTVSFNEYYRRSQGKHLDMRPAEEILAEVNDIRRKIEEGKDGSVQTGRVDLH